MKMKAAHTTLVAQGLALICAITGSPLVSAQSVDASRLSFDIHAKKMEEALTEFAQATQLQVLFQSEIVKQRTAPAVSGTLTPERALQELLADSGLRYEFVNDRTIAIRAGGAAVTVANGYRPTRALEDRVDLVPASESTEGGGDLRDASEQAAKGIPELLVRGSRTLNADIERTRDDVRPYVVLDRKTIERSGAKDIDELVRSRLPMSYVRTPNNSATNTNTLNGNSSQIALRGLSGNETLILIDGRRTTTTMSLLSESQADINSIPLSAIERIEVLPATASGIYGGSATGGVVNVVLRRDYSGFESAVDYEDPFRSGGSTARVSLYGGMSSKDGRTSVLLNGSYSSGDPLQLQDRDFVRDYREKLQESQIAYDPAAYYNAANPVLGATTNISSARVGTTAPNLVLKSGRSLGSSITSVPVGYGGVLTDGGAALVDNAGRYNVDLADSAQAGGGRAGLLGGPKVGSLDVTLRQKFSDRVESFLEVSGSRSDQHFIQLPLVTRFTLLPSSQANPFLQTIVVTAPLNTGDTEIQTRTDSGRALVGTTVSLGEKWSTAFDYSYSTSESSSNSAAANFPTAASNGVTAGTINLIQDPANYTDQLMALGLPASDVSPTRSTLQVASARLGGTLFSTRLGDVRLSVLGEAQRQHYGEFKFTSYAANGTSTITDITDGQYETRSAYSEFVIPLASDAVPVLGVRSAELQIAGRFDKYDVRAAYIKSATGPQSASTRTFDSVDPTVGLRVQATRDVTLRGSYGTGYRPPFLSQLQETPAVRRTLFGITDAKRGNEVVSSVLTSTSGNPQLKPEQSESVSAGFILTPRFVPDLRMSIDWTRIRKHDNIIAVAPNTTFFGQEDLFPGLITRDVVAPGDPYGVGKIIGFDSSFRNATSAVSESLDFALDYSLHIGGMGELVFSSAGTRLIHNTQQSNPAVAPTEQAGNASFPQWAANATVTWNYQSLSLFASGRYLDSHSINVNGSFNTQQFSDRVPSQYYIDLGAQYDLGTSAASGSLWSGLKLQVGVKNLTDRRPRYLVTNTTAFYDTFDDPRMASYFLGLRKAF